MSLIPPFQADGLLPPGDYEVSFEELRKSLLIEGPAGKLVQGTWDQAWRGLLVDNLEVLVRQLWTIGIRDIYADGSFAEDKDHPNDIDGYFVCGLKELASGELVQRLNLLDPYKIWTWDPQSRRPYRGYPKRQLPMWHRYRVEMYPHVPELGLPSGIKDQQGNELEFPSAFRQSRRDGSHEALSKSNMEERHDPQ
jgi:hypothetical protein